MKRNAATLVEALVAIFIMAIGLVTLLTLFPVGAMSMAQALQDDRAATAAANAMALATARNIRHDPAAQGWPDDYFKKPWWVEKNKKKGPSYPIYVDPFGWSLGSHTVGDQVPGIPRQSVSWIVDMPSSWKQNQQMMRSFTLLDDIRFKETGKCKGLATDNNPKQTVDRVGRYSWAYLLRRPNVNDPSVVDVTVVVYSGRLFQLPLREIVYQPVTFDPATTVVRVKWDPAAQDRPPIRKGVWVLDATMPPQGGTDPHGFFYRVVGVTDEATNCVLLELATRPRKGTTQGVLIVMENVVEVFEKGSGWMP
jgi:hypothetical protein